MDLFLLDKLVVMLIHKLMTDAFTQFAFMAGLGVVVNAIFPDKSKDKGSNKK